MPIIIQDQTGRIAAVYEAVSHSELPQGYTRSPAAYTIDLLSGRYPQDLYTIKWYVAYDI